jgi:alkyl sulfatase BDS1-like metallo-beta-lactamase superfamily hydrolase
MAVSLNASKSMDKDMVVGLHLTDINNSTEPSDYALVLRQGIIEVDPKAPDNPDFKVATKSLVWKNLALGKLNPQEAVSNGDVTITGADPQAFYEFFDLFK